MPGPSISLDGVSLKYGDNLILQDIQTQFEAGQCHVSMGPNGGGKTSLLRSVLGLTPFTGDISVHWPDPKQTATSRSNWLCTSKGHV